MPRPLITATIWCDSPRYADWLAVFGTDRVPIESPVAHRGTAPGVGDAMFFRLALHALSPDQRAHIVAYLADHFGEDPAVVEGTIDGEHGVPILADDVLVSMDGRAFL